MEGGQYRVHARRRLPPGAAAAPPSEADAMDASQPEEVLLDENKEAAAHKFYMVAGFDVSPNHRLVAYGEDTVGDEKFTLRVRDLASGRDLLARPRALARGLSLGTPRHGAAGPLSRRAPGPHCSK